MGINAHDLLDFAVEITVPAASEATLRASVSRSYYAAFHALAPFAARLPRSAACPEAVDRVNHRELIERITEWKTESIHPKLQMMTATKGQLRRHVDAACQSRVTADYRLSHEIALVEAQSQIERVKAIMRHVKQIDALLSGEGELNNGREGGTAA